MTTFTGVTAPIYEELAHSDKHILIAGATGSGKSTIMNGMINSLLYDPVKEQALVLCDVKMVEFSRYENTKHCLRLATSPEEVEATLKGVLDMIAYRLQDMKNRGIKIYDKTRVNLFIDELADLVLTSKKATNMLQRICQIGRAAGVKVVCATQCPLASVIPTRIKVNFNIVIGLHTQNKQHSRNILDETGCEELPMFGEALIMYPTTGIKRTKIPLISEEQLDKIAEWDRKRGENG